MQNEIGMIKILVIEMRCNKEFKMKILVMIIKNSTMQADERAYKNHEEKCSQQHRLPKERNRNEMI